jgi:predicted GNAT family N-acyltransferase
MACIYDDLVKLDDSIDVSIFKCTQEDETTDLQDFLRNGDALENQNLFLSTTRVAMIDDRPIGYLSLAMSSIQKENLSKIERASLPPFRFYPAVLIGKLTVDDNYRHNHVGHSLMEDIFVAANSAREYVGCLCMVVDSKKEQNTLDFYNREGFRKIETCPNGNIRLITPLTRNPYCR